MKKTPITIPHTELIGLAYAYYEQQIFEYEGKKNGEAAIDEMIDRTVERWREKCDILNRMYEIETGRRLFVD